MKMIKILQIAVVAMFVLQVIAGVLILAFWTEKLDGFILLVQGIFPVFLSSVIPALIGKPLTEAVRNLTGGKNEKDMAKD